MYPYGYNYGYTYGYGYYPSNYYVCLPSSRKRKQYGAYPYHQYPYAVASAYPAGYYARPAVMTPWGPDVIGDGRGFF